MSQSQKTRLECKDCRTPTVHSGSMPSDRKLWCRNCSKFTPHVVPQWKKRGKRKIQSAVAGA